MKNRKMLLSSSIAAIFEIIFLITGIYSIVTKQWKNLFLSFLAFVCIILPFVIAYIFNKRKIKLPSSFQTVSVTFIFLSLFFGEINNYYIMFWWWDLMLHAIFGSYLVIILIYTLDGNITRESGISVKRFALFSVIFAFSLSVSLGTIWEVFEFLGDYLFNSKMIKGGLEDTCTDIIVKIIFAFFTSIFYFFRIQKNHN